jgi:hypothetical protein
MCMINTTAPGVTISPAGPYVTPQGAPVPGVNTAQNAQGVPSSTSWTIDAGFVRPQSAMTSTSTCSVSPAQGALSGLLCGPQAYGAPASQSLLYDGIPVTTLTTPSTHNLNNAVGQQTAPSQLSVTVL